MRQVLSYPGGTLEFEDDDGRIVAAWQGPIARGAAEPALQVRRALENPIDLPSLNLCVVPGDRVVIAADPGVPALGEIVAVAVNLMESAGIAREDITLLMTDGSPDSASIDLPAGVAMVSHAADVPGDMAYLAATEAGRRVNLNRRATDADFVLAIGSIVRSPSLGWSGPWSVIYPGLSDRETKLSYAAGGSSSASDLLRESAEVGWLLGNQFQIGIVPGVNEPAAIYAGLGESIRDAALRAGESAWTFRVDHRADLVVVGTSPSAGLDATWAALASGAKLVRRGGKVVALSDASGPIGPATRKLLDHEERGASASLRGAEIEPDYPAARQLAEALDWADLYLLSKLEDDQVEELGLIPLSKASEAKRLAAAASEVILVSHAEKTLAFVSEESE